MIRGLIFALFTLSCVMVYSAVGSRKKKEGWHERNPAAGIFTGNGCHPEVESVDLAVVGNSGVGFGNRSGLHRNLALPLAVSVRSGAF